MLKIARFLGAMPPEKPLGDHVAVDVKLEMRQAVDHAP